VTSEVETNHSTLSKIIGMTWQNLPNDERQAWHLKAKEAQEEHKRKWPQYAFRPVASKAQKKKRRVRETEPKDIKRCEKIVELLCKGKKGDDLKHAVKDFDKSHVPEFVTRFEVPITERAYRRSSSAPLPDTDYEQSKQSFKPSVLPHRKRSSSVEPEVLSATAEIKLPTSGLAQFDTALTFDSSPSTPGYSTPFLQREGYIVRSSQFDHPACCSGVLGFFLSNFIRVIGFQQLCFRRTCGFRILRFVPTFLRKRHSFSPTARVRQHQSTRFPSQTVFHTSVDFDGVPRAVDYLAIVSGFRHARIPGVLFIGRV